MAINEQAEVFMDEEGNVVGGMEAAATMNEGKADKKQNALEAAAANQEREDLKQQVGDMIGRVKLGSTIFDYAFHQLYFEDNPDVIQSLKLKTMLSFCIQLIVIKTVFDTELSNMTELIHYGSFSMNIVRTIATLILHLSKFNDFVKAKAMMEFMIANPTKFQSGSLIFPALICILRVVIACLLQFGGMYQLMFVDDGKTALNIAFKLAVIGGFESKFSGLITGVNLAAVIGAKPM